jgi:hypothetical protein
LGTPGPLRRFLGRLGAFVDDSLPFPAEQREERDATGLSSTEESERRQRRFRIAMLEKRGKGGYR